MGLVGYESSDEDTAEAEPSDRVLAEASGPAATRLSDNATGSTSAIVDPEGAAALEESPSLPCRPAHGPAASSKPSGEASLEERMPPPPSPSLDPSQPYPARVSLPSTLDGGDPSEPPRSPYSAARALIHELALPGVPNTCIPPSPPGSPSPGLNAKVGQLLEMKRTRAVHFNDRLANSPALRNPALTDKLLVYVELGMPGPGLTGGGDALRPDAGQYATTLPPDLGWDPASFPTSAYSDSLRLAQARGHQLRERRRGEQVEFVPAGGSEKAGATAAMPSATEKRKARLDG